MRVLAAAAALLASACFSPNFEGAMCSTAGECPEGFSCGADNRCHGAGTSDAAAVPDADPNRPDANPNAPDASPTPDASTFDAVPGTPDAMGIPDAPGLPDAGIIACTLSATGAAEVIASAGICYARYSNRVPWQVASDVCTSRGGHLVTIANGSDHNVVSNLNAGPAMWIGLHDQNAEGMHIWVTNEPPTFTSWQSGEPNGSGDCVHQGNATGGGAVAFWYDNDCGMSFEYVCEFND